ncbi:hypothetical protein BT69DRAFT_457100 [Atractiella rhizophila]|nr:hypothetical protein BT69DRAFT_457100 [Atractiella rhizophila]
MSTRFPSQHSPTSSISSASPSPSLNRRLPSDPLDRLRTKSSTSRSNLSLTSNSETFLPPTSAVFPQSSGIRACSISHFAKHAGKWVFACQVQGERTSYTIWRKWDDFVMLSDRLSLLFPPDRPLPFAHERAPSPSGLPANFHRHVPRLPKRVTLFITRKALSERKEDLDIFVKTLFDLPEIVRDCHLVTEFFSPKKEDELDGKVELDRERGVGTPASTDSPLASPTMQRFDSLLHQRLPQHSPAYIDEEDLANDPFARAAASASVNSSRGSSPAMTSLGLKKKSTPNLRRPTNGSDEITKYLPGDRLPSKPSVGHRAPTRSATMHAHSEVGTPRSREPTAPAGTSEIPISAPPVRSTFGFEDELPLSTSERTIRPSDIDSSTLREALKNAGAIVSNTPSEHGNDSPSSTDTFAKSATKSKEKRGAGYPSTTPLRHFRSMQEMRPPPDCPLPSPPKKKIPIPPLPAPYDGNVPVGSAISVPQASQAQGRAPIAVDSARYRKGSIGQSGCRRSPSQSSISLVSSRSSHSGSVTSGRASTDFSDINNWTPATPPTPRSQESSLMAGLDGSDGSPFFLNSLGKEILKEDMTFNPDGSYRLHGGVVSPKPQFIGNRGRSYSGTSVSSIRHQRLETISSLPEENETPSTTPPLPLTPSSLSARRPTFPTPSANQQPIDSSPAVYLKVLYSEECNVMIKVPKSIPLAKLRRKIEKKLNEACGAYLEGNWTLGYLASPRSPTDAVDAGKSGISFLRDVQPIATDQDLRQLAKILGAKATVKVLV